MNHFFTALPPAVAQMVKKYQAAAAAFMPPAPAAAPGAAWIHSWLRFKSMEVYVLSQ